jgi:hypothetical protein
MFAPRPMLGQRSKEVSGCCFSYDVLNKQRVSITISISIGFTIRLLIKIACAIDLRLHLLPQLRKFMIFFNYRPREFFVPLLGSLICLRNCSKTCNVLG